MDDAQRQEMKVEGKRQWLCEFCETTNLVPDDYVLPKEENPCYLREEGKMEEKKAGYGEKTIIYCVDISGSMDCGVAGKSRLEAVKEAINDEVNRMKFEKEKVRIGIITFGSLVSLYGKNGETTVIPQQHYYTLDKIRKFCE